MTSKLLLPSLIIISVLLGCVTAHASSQKFDQESALSRLDSLLDTSSDMMDSRHAEISAALSDYAKASTDSDRYAVSRRLFSCYRTFRCDSAMIVAGMRLQLARRLNDRHKTTSASLNLADTYMSSGDYQSAIRTIDTLPRSVMAPYHLKSLYNTYATAYSNLADQELIPFNRLQLQNLASQYTDSALTCYTPHDNSYYVLRARLLASRNMTAEALEVMRQAESTLTLRPSDEYFMAGLLNDLGKRDEAIEYLIHAATTDLQRNVYTSGHLLQLAILLNREGDHERAYHYLRHALTHASEASARNLENKILQAVPLISDALHERDSDIMSRQRLWLTVSAILAVALAIALMMVWANLRRNRRMTRLLNVSNDRLAETNRRLADADLIKQRYISELFDIYSDSIEQQISLKKRFMRMLKSSQFDQALKLAGDNSSEHEALRDLYTRFDSIFLSLFPDFIRDFNSMVDDEYRLEDGTQSLTPETRVLAMMRLGITGSGQIAKVLHYSPQTVYNYKSRIKSFLTISQEEFDRHLPFMGTH